MLKRTLSNSFGRGPLLHKMGGYVPPASIYFSACKLRSKGKGDRREPIPLLIYSISKIIMSVDNGVFEQCRQMYLFTMGKNTGVALATFAYDV